MDRGRRVLLFSILLALIGTGVFYSIKKLEFEESLSSVMPVDENNMFLVGLLDSASFFDRMVVHVYTPDSLPTNASQLVKTAQQLSDSIRLYYMPRYIEAIEGKTRSDIQDVLFTNFANNLPLYLNDGDYKYIDSLIASEDFSPLVKEHFKVLNSPAGYMASKFLFSDPLGMISKQFKRLENLQVDDNLMVYKNYLLSKDKRHLTFFLIPTDAGNTGKNTVFIDSLNTSIAAIKQSHNNQVEIEYTGSLPIATANANQIKRDVQITINIAIVVIVLLILYFYRRWQYLALVLLPALIGATFALVVFTLFLGKISAISLGIASVLLGISVDYALHIFTHLKHTNNISQVKKDVSLPIFMSSLTTGSAFLGLMVLSSPAMRQLGLFAAISVIISALFAIYIMPKLIGHRKDNSNIKTNTFIEYLSNLELQNKNWNFFIILILTIFFALYIPKVKFEDDFERLNYMPQHLENAVSNLDRAGDFSGKKMYLLSEGNNLDEAITNAQTGAKKLDSLQNIGAIEKYNSILSLVANQTQQTQKIQQWNTFWTKERIEKFTQQLSRAATAQHIKPNAYKQFTHLLHKSFAVTNPDSIVNGFDNVASSFVIEKGEKVFIAQIIHSHEDFSTAIAQVFQADNKNHIIDKKAFFTNMFENLQTDFDQLLYISLAIVFFIILFFLGRIELTLVTLIPIIISWVWTLGIIGLFEIKLNFFNIVICSLIFGLGVDYAIFITRGLMQKHKTGSNKLSSYKSSILISGITTLVGLGVLLFAQHPALKSIAGLAVVGILSSLIISFSLQPLLFRFLVGSDNKKLRNPITFLSFAYTTLTFTLWAIGSLLATVFIPLLIILPIAKSKKRYLVRFASSKVCKFVLWVHPLSTIDKRNFDKFDLNQPSVIVSNHQSMADILLFLSLSPNIIILTKDWVWNNLLFGVVVRYSGHINVSTGYDTLQNIIQERINEGCSIVVFPEGSRSIDGKIKRYHKGGFFMAQQSNLPIHKLVIHGMHELLSRDSLNLGKCVVTIKYLSTYIFNKPEENTYSKISKSACSETRMAYAEINQEKHVFKSNNYRITRNFIYKGPVLEHYVKVKMAIEDNYQIFDQIVPKKGRIYDLGCGYGTMSMMLKMRSPERELFASDYDKEKIATAQHTQLNSDLQIAFEAADALEYKMGDANCIILSDMLHYFLPEQQLQLIQNCYQALAPNGKLIIRDADPTIEKRHKGTEITEYFSTALIGFNKTRNKLHFFTRNFIEEFANKYNMSTEVRDESKRTSNIIYILSKT